jgi:hypothetical protein
MPDIDNRDFEWMDTKPPSDTIFSPLNPRIPRVAATTHDTALATDGLDTSAQSFEIGKASLW